MKRKATIRCCLCGRTQTDPIYEKEGHTVGRCTGCGLLRTVDVAPDYEKLYTDDGYHDAPYRDLPYRDRYDHDYDVSALRLPEHVKRGRRTIRSILDVGCANGAFVAYAARQGYVAEGIEVNPKMRAWARGMTCQPIHSSWMDVSEKWFDAIAYHDVIEHIRDPDAELRTARAALERDGLLVLDTPDADHVDRHRLGAGWHHLRPREHLWYFTEEHLVALVTGAGFRALDIDRPIPGKLVLYATPENGSGVRPARSKET